VSRLRRLIERLRRAFTESPESGRTVAIACQGGGSHAAFTAGVLAGLFEDLPDEYRVVGLSGASGGAVAAAAAWYGHMAAGTTPAATLEGVWEEIAATTGWEFWVNELTLMKTQIPGSNGISTPSPYRSAASDWGRQQLESTLTEHIDFTEFHRLATDPNAPALIVSAANVLSGEQATFRAADISADEIVASAAVPRLFEAVEIDGEYYWDGFLSQNPPLRQFVVGGSVPSVDELWIVRLTPETADDVPRSEDDIHDRTQQLVENLSLAHEMKFVELVNEWVSSGRLVDGTVTETNLRTIDLHKEMADTSRLNRRSTFISDLYADGQAEAANFLEELTAD
jgi:NTE family protein